MLVIARMTEETAWSGEGEEGYRVGVRVGVRGRARARARARGRGRGGARARVGARAMVRARVRVGVSVSAWSSLRSHRSRIGQLCRTRPLAVLGCSGVRIRQRARHGVAGQEQRDAPSQSEEEPKSL